MSVYIFAGPTIDHDTIATRCDYTCLPPVSQGDIYKVCKSRPRAIGIIDGFFQGVPSVWHKEILWAMDQGVHVFGSASMGALRAAELHQFGMRGVGEVFRLFLDNDIEDDDEVALTHGPAELNHSPLTEAMVNVRATLECAASEGIIDEESAKKLEETAKNIFYPERTWKALSEAWSGILDEQLLQALERWLESGKVNIKRQDALDMLSEMDKFLSGDPAPNKAKFDFEHTVMWDGLIGETDSQAEEFDSTDPDSRDDWLVLNELRLDPEAYKTASLHAVITDLTTGATTFTHIEIDHADLQARISEFRQSRGLYTQKSFTEFLSNIRVTESEFGDLMEEEMLTESLLNQTGSDLDSRRLNYLRVSGKYEALAERAKHKAELLAGSDQNEFTPRSIGLLPQQVVESYFSYYPTHAPSDLDQYIQSIGIIDRESFYRLLTEEYVYCNLKEVADP